MRTLRASLATALLSVVLFSAPQHVSGQADWADLTAQEIVLQVRGAFAQGVAAVDNYYVAEKWGPAPPTVHYYEKEMIEGRPVFRLVPPYEVAERDATGGHPELPPGAHREILPGLAEAIDIVSRESGGTGVGSALSGLLGEVSDGLRKADEEMKAQIEEDEQENDRLLEQIIESDVFAEAATLVGCGAFFTGRPSEERYEPLDCDDPQPRGAGGAYILRADRLAGAGSDGIPSQAVEWAELWVERTSGFPLVFRAQVAGATEGGTQRAMIEKIHISLQPVGQMVLPKETLYMVRLVGAGEAGAIPEIRLRTGEPVVNQGPPTQQQMAELIAAAMERWRFQ